MKSRHFFILILFCHTALAQTDTVVVSDFTNMMVKAIDENRVVRVRDLSDHVSAGFFLSDVPEGMIRFCTEDPITIWVNGRFLRKVESNCEIIDPTEIFKNVTEDSVFVAVHSFTNLSGTTINEVLFLKETVIREARGLSRDVEDVFHEFSITFYLITLFMIGLVVTRYRNRFQYVIKKSLSLKYNSYELANTSFFSEVGIIIAFFLSMIVAFWGIYSGVTGPIRLFEVPTSYLEFILLLAKTSVFVFSYLVIKWTLISVVSSLFGFKKLNNHQLFDFVNFGMVVGGLLLVTLFLNFLFDESAVWIATEFRVSLIILTILFIPWFTLKFVSNSPHNKLLIISYLCATELIPAVLLIGWFFK